MKSQSSYDDFSREATSDKCSAYIYALVLCLLSDFLVLRILYELVWLRLAMAQHGITELLRWVDIERK